MTLQFGGRVNCGVVQPEGGPAGSRFHRRLGIGRLALQAGRGRRQADVRGQPRARGAQPGARGALFLRPAPRQLRVRDWQSGPRLGDRRSASTPRCAGGIAASAARSRYFRNSIDDYIFRNPISDEEFDERSTGRGDEAGEFPFVEFVARRQRAAGRRSARGHRAGRGLRSPSSGSTTSAASSGHRRAAAADSAVRGSRGGLRYQSNAFQAGGEVVAAAEAGSRLRRGNADRRLQPAEAVRVVLVRPRRRRSTRSPRASTTRPTSSIATTCRSSRTSCPRWVGISRWCIR